MIAFSIGQIVYLKIKAEVPGMVTGILVRPTGPLFLVTWSSDMTERYHYAVELTAEKSFATVE